MSRNAPAELNILAPLEDIAKTSPDLLGRALAELDLAAAIRGLPAEILAQVNTQRVEALRFAGEYLRESTTRGITQNLRTFVGGYESLMDSYTSPLSEFDMKRLSNSI